MESEPDSRGGPGCAANSKITPDMNNPTARSWLCTLAVSALALQAAGAAETVGLTELDLTRLQYAGWEKPQIDRTQSGKPLSIAGREFEHGVATYATGSLWLELDGRTERFTASVGVDDSATGANAAVVFEIFGDDRRLWESRALKRGEPAQAVDLGLHGVHSLLLKIDHAGEGDGSGLGDWADARFSFAGARPRTVPTPQETAVILTPKPSAAPQINGPRVYGCRTGHPFLFRIPTTGERPVRFSADALPAGLRLDADNGYITGTAPPRGTYAVTLRAENRHGAAVRLLRIVSGDKLALTPPMGWNHWYAYYNRITDPMIREAADAMVRSGMADAGYAYVNIDDCWMNTAADAQHQPDPLRTGPFRDAQGNIVPNRHFPDMPALTAYIHAKGLKAGIYTSPGPLTCGGYCGAYQHEEQDARQFAEWGFDFLKYDWCSYGHIAEGGDPRAPNIPLWGHGSPNLEGYQRPYRLMGGILNKLPRDVVFNLCQYGMANVWEWGAEVGGQSWRTAGDLGGELNRIFAVALKNAEHREWTRPGAWNDPDYIQIGYIGDARTNGEPRPCPLTPTEQYAFMSLWCLSAAPLFYSGDMGRLDEFTLNVLCNPEVIAVDQDSLGECARVVPLTPETFLMVKDLEDGGKAVGFCNRGEITAGIVAKWADLGVSGRQMVRDLWRQRDLGPCEGAFEASVPRHGVALVRLAPHSD